MMKRHITECFQKSITLSSNVLTDVWHDAVIDQLLVINDFVQHKSHDTSSLTVQEVRRIHRNNAKHSLRKSFCKDLEMDSDHSNIFTQNVTLQDVSNTGPKDDAIMFNSSWKPETLITDELLDLFDIPPGYKRGRLKMFYKNSEILYNYLCYVIGSERIVKLRRRSLQKKFVKHCIQSYTWEVSGSKAEGLDMKGSDLDMMLIVDHFGAAYEDNALSKPKDDIYLQYKSSNLQPGYVLVELVTCGECMTIPSLLMKASLVRLGRAFKFMVNTTIHGPSLSISAGGDDLDIVPTLRCETWPEIANEWIKRERKFGWPSQEMINLIVTQGCCIVPVSSKTNHANDGEWRLSFSLAEKTLVCSFNHTQLLVYGLLKLILKEIVNPKKEVPQLLCSYFLKTTLFWIIEDTHASIWKPQLIIPCFRLCLERLIQFIAEDNCPNYFVRINNMFSGRFSISDKTKLLQIFFNIFEKGLSWTLESETLDKLMHYIEDPLKLIEFRRLQKKKDLTEIVGHAFDFIRFSKRLLFTTYGWRKNILKPWLKSLFKVPIVRTFLRHEDFLDTRCILNDNKKANSLRKLHLFLLCSGCSTDLAAGKLKLASWLYNEGQFNSSLELADLAISFSKYRIAHVGVQTTTMILNHFIPTTNVISEGDLIQTFYRFTTSDVHFCYDSCILPREFTLIWRALERNFSANVHNNAFFYSFLPEYFSHFLRFLCLNKLGEIKRSHDALIEIQSVKTLGSKYEQMVHSFLTSYLRIIGNMVENKTENEWIQHTSSVVDVLRHFSPNNFEGLNLSTFMSIFQHLEFFGIDPAFMQSCFSSCRIS